MTVRPRLHRWSGKLSDYRFRKLLRHFVRDDTVSDTARAMRLSVNTVSEQFGKLRRFMANAGLFAELDVIIDQIEAALPEEWRLFLRSPYRLEFHEYRMYRRRGRRPKDGEELLRLENAWRYPYAKLCERFTAADVEELMLRDLLAILKRCGPLGAGKVNSLCALEEIALQRTWIARVFSRTGILQPARPLRR